MEPASALKRLAAFCIDYLMILIMSVITVFLFVRLFDNSSNVIWDSIKTFFNTAANMMPAHSKIATIFSFYLTHMGSGIIICGIITFVYFTYFEQSKDQATIGKKLLNLKVKTVTNTQLSLSQAVTRVFFFVTPALFFYFLAFSIYPQCLKVINVSFHLFQFKFEIPKACVNLFTGYTLCYLIWFLPIFFTKEKSTVYDMLSNTRVKE